MTFIKVGGRVAILAQALRIKKRFTYDPLRLGSRASLIKVFVDSLHPGANLSL